MTHTTGVIEQDQPHPPVSIAKVRLLGSFGGQIMIEWTLTAPVDERWIDAFSRTPVRRPGRHGLTGRGGGEPVVSPDGAIRWSVPHADLRDAALVVMQSVASANQVVEGRWTARTPRTTAVGAARRPAGSRRG